MSLTEIKDFNALIDNKPFFDHPLKSKQEAYENLLICQGTITMQQKLIRFLISLNVL